MKKIAIGIAAAAFLVLSFFAGYQSNNTVTVKTETVTKTVDNPVEHCIAGTIHEFPGDGNVITECENLTDSQAQEVKDAMNDFTDRFFEYIESQ